MDSWQLCRTAPNLAAHDDETDDALIAENLNVLQVLQPVLNKAASRLPALCAQSLVVTLTMTDFKAGFQRVYAVIGA